MEKLSDYLPLIIILIALVSSFFRNKKRQSEVTEKTTLPGKTAGEVVEDKSLRRSKSALLKKILADSAQKPGFEKYESPRKKEVAPSFSSDAAVLEEEDVSPSFSFEEDDDVVKAIIYSEIINKKDY